MAFGYPAWFFFAFVFCIFLCSFDLIYIHRLTYQYTGYDFSFSFTSFVFFSLSIRKLDIDITQ